MTDAARARIISVMHGCRIALLVLALLVSPVVVHAAIFTVNSTGDAADATAGNGVCATSGGVCTLRAALNEANALAGTDTINFGIAGAGVHTITPASPLPVGSSMVIDGTTQLGIGAGPFILLDGTNTVTSGLEFATVSGISVTIQGLAIGRFTEAGIKTYQSGGTGVTIKRCHIGVGADGITDMGNGDGIWARIQDFTGSSLIVGDAAGGGNVISGNNDLGIEIEDSPNGAKLTTFTLQGNIIGLASDGMTQVANVSGGVRTDLQFGTLTIGGSIAGRNIISGNGGGGYITNSFLQADVINASYNYIGLASDGITARGNNGTAMSLVGKQYAIVSNVIGANQSHGLLCTTGTMPSAIRGNRIGVAIDGSPRGNGGNGVRVNNFSGGMSIGGAGADANIIANNGADGIAVGISGDTQIAENSIYANGGLGIDLNEDGVTANDAGDTDTGGNDLQNYPTINSAVRSGGVTFVNGVLSSAASSTYTLRFYASTSPDPSGFGEGETYLGATTAITNAIGNTSFTFQYPIAQGLYVTATATNPAGNTSEFSNAVIVTGPPQIRMAAPSATTPESGNVTLTIERVFGASGTASVDWMTIPGSAGTSDFTFASGTVNFANGETSKTINIAITPDLLDETNESFTVELSNVSTGTELGAADTTVHITDDDSPPSISIANASAIESNAPLAFNVTLSAASERTITVDYVTSNGTAIAGSDYAAAAGTLTFAPLETTKTLNVQLVNDANIEVSETFTVTLSNPANVAIGGGTATGTITDDDGAPTITIGDVAIVEGDSGTSSALFTVTLSGPSASSVTVDWSTSDGTATAGVDYEAGSGTVTFAPGEVTKPIAVTINGDALVESNETFSVDLASPNNATLADAQGGGTIADDDGTPSLSINDPAVVEGVGATFTVTLAPASALPVTVSYASSNGTATASDYTGDANTLTFAAGETSKTIVIATLDDAIAETAEEFAVALSGVMGATIGDANGTATIIDNDGAPRITIGNVTAAEGNGGNVTFTLDVDLSHASASAVSVDYSFADGTATAASGDYASGGGTLTFAPGDTSQTISVSVAGDTLIETDETVLVHLANASNAIVIDDEAVATIANDDGAASVSIENATINEGTGGALDIEFAVELSAASALPVNVQWATADGTASSGSDYTAGAGTITFAPGEVLKTIAIAVNTDSTFEANESFVLNLIAATNASIADAQGTGTLVNDDPAPVVPAISIGNASLGEGDAGTALMTFTVQLNVATINTVTVDYATGGGSAVAGTDYVATNGTLTFAPGVTTQTIAVPVIGDTLVESNETFVVTLTSPVNAVAGTMTATGTILEDDVAPVVPSITIAPASIAEGNAGSASMTFAVQLSAPTVATVTVNYATSNATAIAGADYANTSGLLTFTPGVTSQSIVIPVVGDTLVEGNETFVVTLTSPSNGTLGTASANGTILDDDTAPVVPSISIAPASLAEGNAGSASMTFAVQLSAPTVATVTVNYATSDATAIAGADYASASGTLTFAPGVTSQSIAVPVIGDTAVESNETLTVVLTSPSNSTLGTPSAIGTIFDDDSLPFVPSIAIGDVTRNEGDSGATVFAFTVTLDAAAPVPVSVSWTTVAGSASATSDFVATNGTVVFAPGMTSQSITVAVHGDDTRESDETFVVMLSAPSNGTLGDASATGTIRNDDDRAPTIPTLTAATVTVDENAGEAFVTLTLSSRPSSGASVRWLTRAGTATGTTDFIEASGRIPFISTTATIPLTIVDDDAHEDAESFVVEFFDADGITLDDLRTQITITDDDAAATPRAIVLVAGSLQGDAGSRFGTAVQMVNASDTRAEGNILLHAAGTSDTTFDRTVAYSLAPHELRSWNDLLAENGLTGLATIDILPTFGAIPAMTVRIYDDGADGTTGFTLPTVSPSDALTTGETGLLIAPSDPIASRFNIGVRTLEQGATLIITVRNHTGTIVHTESRDFPASYFQQLPANTFTGTTLTAGDYIEVRINSGSALLYGAAVDNVTNDPSVQVVTKK